MMWFDENYHRASRVKNTAVAVVGSGGRLGEVLANALSKRHRVVALNRGDMDLSDGDSIRRVLGAIDYEYLFLIKNLSENSNRKLMNEQTRNRTIKRDLAGKKRKIAFLLLTKTTNPLPMIDSPSTAMALKRERLRRQVQQLTGFILVRISFTIQLNAIAIRAWRPGTA